MTTDVATLPEATETSVVLTRDEAQKCFDTLVELRKTMNRTGYEIGARCNEFYRRSMWEILGFEAGDDGFNQALVAAFGKQHTFARLVMKRVEQLPLILTSGLKEFSPAVLNELMRLGDEANNPIWGEYASTMTEEELLAEIHKALNEQDSKTPQHNETQRTWKIGSLPDSLYKLAGDTLEGFRKITKALGLGESNEVALEYMLRAACECPHLNADGVVEDPDITNERFLETLDAQQGKAMQKFTAKKMKASAKPKHVNKRVAEKETKKKAAKPKAEKKTKSKKAEE